MLLYEEKQFTFEELIIYLNELKTKSTVLDLRYDGCEVEVVYSAEDDYVNSLLLRDFYGLGDDEDFISVCCTYSNIAKKVFTAKICGWKQISYLELLSIVVNKDPIEIAFQITGDEELYPVETMDAFKRYLDDFEGMYDDDEVLFFKENE